MLVEIFIIFQIIALILWFIAFYTKQEIIWAIAAVFLAFLMMSAWHIEILVPVYNTTLNVYQYQVEIFRYNYLSWINTLFFALAMIFGLVDLFDKYGKKFKV